MVSIWFNLSPPFFGYEDLISKAKHALLADGDPLRLVDFWHYSRGPLVQQMAPGVPRQLPSLLLDLPQFNQSAYLSWHLLVVRRLGHSFDRFVLGLSEATQRGPVAVLVFLGFEAVCRVRVARPQLAV